MAVEQDGDRAHIAQDAGHVRGCRERADLQRPVDELDERGLEPVDVDPAVPVLRDHDEVGQRLAPRQLIAVVLVGPDEHDRALGHRDRGTQVIPVIEVGRQPDLQAVDQLVDRARGPRAGEQDDVVGAVRADGISDDPAGILAELRRLPAGPRRFGMGVAVEREDRLADEVLDEGERPTRGRVVGVGDPTQPERPEDGFVLPDDAGLDRLDERSGRRILGHRGPTASRASSRR